jgi:hypothetical protein
VIIGGDMPVIASISRVLHPASRNFSTLEARTESAKTNDNRPTHFRQSHWLGDLDSNQD